MDDKIYAVKKHVTKLIEDSGFSYSTLATKLGKNPTYIQKFCKEDSPRRLDEYVRRGLAEILQVNEQELTDLPIIPHLSGVASIAETIAKTIAPQPKTATVDIIDVKVCCGKGIDNIAENITGSLVIPLHEFKEITAAAPDNIKLIRAQGDSMEPTICDGDRVWVDVSNNFFSSDGIYVIRIVDNIVIKRVQIGPGGLNVKSDNPQYSSFPLSDEMQICGKIVYIWNGRRV